MASLVYQISFFFLLGMLAILAILVARRWRGEVSRAKHEKMRQQAVRSYLAQIEGADEPARIDTIPTDTKLEAISHLLRLTRGADREKLLKLADEDRLFANAIAASNSSRPARRSEAILILEQFGSPRCLQTLEILLANDNSTMIRLEAAAALARLRALPSLRDLISLLALDRTRPIRLHIALFASLAETNPEQIRELLATDIPAYLRAMLIDALSSSGDFQDMLEFERAATHEEAEVRSAALRAARRFGDPRCEKWVLPMLSDPIDYVRMQAAQTIAKLGFARARPALEEMTGDESIWVRVRVSEALSLLPGAAA